MNQEFTSSIKIKFTKLTLSDKLINGLRLKHNDTIIVRIIFIRIPFFKFLLR